MQGKLKIWGTDESGYWEIQTTCDQQDVWDVIQTFAEGRDGFEDYDSSVCRWPPNLRRRIDLWVGKRAENQLASLVV
jgi:hypothetical protein